MSVALLNRWEARVEARRDLASAVMREIPRAERSLIVQLLARTFVDTYAHSVQNGSPAQLVEWVDRMCDAHADSPAVTKLFDGACRSLDEFFAQSGVAERERSPLRLLDDSLRPVLQKPRQTRTAVHEHLDEVDAAINRMLARLEGADPLTAEHSRAVSAWCARLARRLSLSEQETTYVARSGMIHDVGKVTTPPTILQAPRKLTDSEWVVMREHTTYGEQIILEDDRLVEFSSIVRAHHERLDGRGYPDGRARDEVPLAARIVTVADCFNAMIGRRPYRPAMAPSDALEQLQLHKGSQFDAEVVAAMHEVVHQR
jgi:HD-GYP domain-containing protein (c-di-GMP phosphodiesterase class II)